MIGAIAGDVIGSVHEWAGRSVAQAAYGVPPAIRARALTYLDEHLTRVVEAFEARYGLGAG